MSREVRHRFAGIQADQLAAELLRLEGDAAQPAHATVRGCHQPGRAATDNGHVVAHALARNRGELAVNLHRFTPHEDIVTRLEPQARPAASPAWRVRVLRVSVLPIPHMAITPSGRSATAETTFPF